AQVRGEDSAQQDAGRGATSSGRSVDAERDVAIATLGERRHQERERGRGEERSAEALDGAEGDQRALGPGKSAEERAEREDGQSDDEQAPTAEQVTQPPAQQKRSSEHDR